MTRQDEKSGEELVTHADSYTVYQVMNTIGQNGRNVQTDTNIRT